MPEIEVLKAVSTFCLPSAGASGCVLASPASLCSCRPLEILTGDLWLLCCFGELLETSVL